MTKLVIDIPRKTYEHIRSCGGHGIFNIQGDDNLIVTKAIFNSKPILEDPAVKWPQGDWIPVSKKLPEDMQNVLIWFEYYRYGDFNCMYQTYGFGYVCDGKWSSFINGHTGWHKYRVIAWMPLPKRYEVVEND